MKTVYHKPCFDLLDVFLPIFPLLRSYLPVYFAFCSVVFTAVQNTRSFARRQFYSTIGPFTFVSRLNDEALGMKIFGWVAWLLVSLLLSFNVIAGAEEGVADVLGAWSYNGPSSLREGHFNRPFGSTLSIATTVIVTFESQQLVRLHPALASQFPGCCHEVVPAGTPASRMGFDAQKTLLLPRGSVRVDRNRIILNFMQVPLNMSFVLQREVATVVCNLSTAHHWVGGLRPSPAYFSFTVRESSPLAGMVKADGSHMSSVNSAHSTRGNDVTVDYTEYEVRHDGLFLALRLVNDAWNIDGYPSPSMCNNRDYEDSCDAGRSEMYFDQNYNLRVAIAQSLVCRPTNCLARRRAPWHWGCTVRPNDLNTDDKLASIITPSDIELSPSLATVRLTPSQLQRRGFDIAAADGVYTISFEPKADVQFTVKGALSLGLSDVSRSMLISPTPLPPPRAYLQHYDPRTRSYTVKLSPVSITEDCLLGRADAGSCDRQLFTPLGDTTHGSHSFFVWGDSAMGNAPRMLCASNANAAPIEQWHLDLAAHLVDPMGMWARDPHVLHVGLSSVNSSVDIAAPLLLSFKLPPTVLRQLEPTDPEEVGQIVIVPSPGHAVLEVAAGCQSSWVMSLGGGTSDASQCTYSAEIVGETFTANQSLLTLDFSLEGGDDSFADSVHRRLGRCIGFEVTVLSQHKMMLKVASLSDECDAVGALQELYPYVLENSFTDGVPNSTEWETHGIAMNLFGDVVVQPLPLNGSLYASRLAPHVEASQVPPITVLLPMPLAVTRIVAPFVNNTQSVAFLVRSQADIAEQVAKCSEWLAHTMKARSASFVTANTNAAHLFGEEVCDLLVNRTGSLLQHSGFTSYCVFTHSSQLQSMPPPPVTAWDCLGDL